MSKSIGRIIVLLYVDTEHSVNGNIYYLEELAQYLELEEHMDTVYVYNISDNFNRKKYYSDRYTFINKEIRKLKSNDVLITDTNALEKLFIKEPTFINDIKYCFIMNDSKTHLEIINIYTDNFSIINNNIEKFYLLVERKFETDSLQHLLFKNRIIYFTRGFYFNQYVSKTNHYDDNWFVYDILNGTAYINDTTYKEIAKFCRINHYATVIKRSKFYHIANSHMGLFYIKHKDYMPRLPYEFWYYKKPVVFFDRSDGLLKRFRKDELPLYLPIIRTNIPNIDAKALCNFLRREGYCDRRT